MCCLSTHNEVKTLSPENVAHAIGLNQIFGSRFVVMASAGKLLLESGIYFNRLRPVLLLLKSWPGKAPKRPKKPGKARKSREKPGKAGKSPEIPEALPLL
jgi:hypothetical protein